MGLGSGYCSIKTNEILTKLKTRYDIDIVCLSILLLIRIKVAVIAVIRRVCTFNFIIRDWTYTALPFPRAHIVTLDKINHTSSNKGKQIM